MSYVRTTRFKRGFTLVELSIVIVIIGLIVSGVTAGSSLVHSAKLQNVISNYKKYDVAISAFRMQYNDYPGNLRNAESYWGTYNSSTNPNGVINGNGDGWVGDNDIVGQESMQAWAHLSRAKLVEGNYTGVGSVQIGVTDPDAKLNSNSAFWVRSSGQCQSSGGACDNGKPNPNASKPVIEISGAGWLGWVDPSIPVNDAQALDRKIDDGFADRGKFGCWNDESWNGPLTACSNWNTNVYSVGSGAMCNCDMFISSHR